MLDLDETILTTQEVADLLGISANYVYRLTYTGKLAFTLIGPPRRGVRQYRLADVEAFQKAYPAIGHAR